MSERFSSVRRDSLYTWAVARELCGLVCRTNVGSKSSDPAPSLHATKLTCATTTLLSTRQLPSSHRQPQSWPIRLLRDQPNGRRLRGSMARSRYHQQRLPVPMRQMQGGMDRTTAMLDMVAIIQTGDMTTRHITTRLVRPTHRHTDRRRNLDQCARRDLQVGGHRLVTTVVEAILGIGRQGNNQDLVSNSLVSFLEHSLTRLQLVAVLRQAHPSTTHFPPFHPEETLETDEGPRHAG